MRSLSRLLLLSSALALFPGCAWFVGGGVAAVILALQPEEEAETAPVVQITAAARLTASPGQVTYTLHDAEGDACDVTVEYKVGASGTFHIATKATGGDGTAGLAPGSYTFAWDYDTDAEVTLPETLDVTIRVTAVDTTGKASEAVSAGHSLGNAPPVIESIDLPDGLVTGTATVEYVLSDTHGDTSQIDIQFRAGTTGTWTDATADASGAYTNLGSAPSPGVAHFFPWDSDDPNDLEGEDADAFVRIRASDDGGNTWGSWLETTETVSIRNDTAPQVQIGPIPPFHERGIIHIPYTILDVEGDEVTILPEFRPYGGSAWRRTTAGPATSRLFLTAPSGGTSGVFSWDTARDGLYAQGVDFRLTASQSNVAGVPSNTSFSLANDGSMPWVSKEKMPTERHSLCCVAVRGTIYAIGGRDETGDLDTVEAYDPILDGWTTRSSLPTLREGFSCAAVGGKIYAVGGFVSTSGYMDTVEEYDPVQDAWTTRASLSKARTLPTCAAVAGKLYAIGGFGIGGVQNIVEEYDPAQDAWATKATMPTARHSLSCAVFGGKIYSIGGRDSVPTYLDNVDVFDPAEDSWTTKTPMPTGRSNLSCAAIGEKIYAIGGSDGSVDLSAVEEYDPHQDTWATKTDMTTARSDFGCATVAGKAYAVGGSAGSTHLDAVEEYDPVRDGWTSRSDMPATRRLLSCAVVGGKLYAVGGDDLISILDDVEEYDPVLDVWTSRASMPTPRRGLSCAVVGEKVYAVGGYGSGMYQDTVEEYDPADDGWTTKMAMPTERNGLSCAAVGGKLYAVGGSNSGGELKTVEEYDPVGNTWETKATMPTARQFFSCAAVGGKLYAFGGCYGTMPIVTLNTVEVYDPVQDTWMAKASMPTKRWGSSCAVIGGKVYVIGGKAVNELDTVEVYDPDQDAWTTRPGMPLARYFLTCGSVGGKVYAIGGQNSGGYSSDVEAYDPVVQASFAFEMDSTMSSLAGACLGFHDGSVFLFGGRGTSPGAMDACAGFEIVGDVPASHPFEIRRTWTARASLNTARREAGSVSHGGTVYVLGGFDANDDAVPSMETYDAASDAWTVSANPMTTARGGLGVVCSNGKIYAIGGETGSGKTGDVEIYDITGGSWSTGTSMGTARSHFGIGAIPDTGLIYVFGGEVAGGAPTDSVERYDPVADTWKTSEDAVDPLSTLPLALEGTLCLFERDNLKLFGGERTGGFPSARIFLYEHSADQYRLLGESLPYPARDLFGVTAAFTWNHRGTDQSDEFCLLGGGYDGVNYRDGFFRFYTR